MLTTAVRHIPAIAGSLLLFAVATPARAQVPSSPAQRTGPWTFTTHVVLTGSSDPAESDPEGYRVYSAFALDAAVRRRMGSRFAVEMGVRTESREATVLRADGEEVPLGSVEALPVSLVLQYLPGAGERFRPYVGAGLNLTVVWEKSGALDSTDLSPSVAPAVQLGTDIRLSSRVFLNLDVKWNPWRTDIEVDREPLARLRIDPLAVGLGVGFRF